jgi:hypothetical protein
MVEGTNGTRGGTTLRVADVLARFPIGVLSTR